uniref:Uncharacterized protein n=1 Tax=Cacopsylla melanoneura TaxID=428564 RepID=A0A8D9FAS5_9HEMI
MWIHIYRKIYQNCQLHLYSWFFHVSCSVYSPEYCQCPQYQLLTRVKCFQSFFYYFLLCREGDTHYSLSMMYCMMYSPRRSMPPSLFSVYYILVEHNYWFVSFHSWVAYHILVSTR